MTELVEYVVVALFGVLVGTGELLSRYRDAPFEVIRGRPALFYLFINATAAAAGLLAIQVFDWHPAQVGSLGDAALRVLTAGFGSMALFRSSLFTVRAGDSDITIGPHAFLTVLLTAVDREVDRLRANRRAHVNTMMQDIDFVKASVALPTFALALMQNLPPEQEANLGRLVKNLSNAQIGDALKSRILGLILMNVVGESVLSTSVEALRSELKVSSPP